MPRGSAKGEHRGGRKLGTKNRSTIERALIAERTVDNARKVGKELGVDVMEKFMFLFAGIATTNQPYPPSQPQNPDYNEDRFEKYARLTLDAAKEVAKYQSPQFRAIMVAPAPDHAHSKSTRFTLQIFEHSANDPPALINGGGRTDH